MFRSIFSRVSRTVRTSIVTIAAISLTAGAAAAGTVMSGRAWAHSTNQHYVWVGASDRHVVVRGDGDTDLDCWLYGPNGELVSSDTDGTDVCVLPAPGVGTHRVVIHNYGSVYNDYVFGTTTR